MKIKATYLLVGMTILASICCSKPSNTPDRRQRVKKENLKSTETSILKFREIYRYPDDIYLEMVDFTKSRKIVGFKSIVELDIENYRPNFIGVTDKLGNKQTIIDQLLTLDSIPFDELFAWSKHKEHNVILDERFYRLYLLKEIDKTIDILPSEIAVIKVQDATASKEPSIMIKLNKEGTIKWSKLTERSYQNNNNYVAMTIDGDVYSCPSIMSPIYSGFASIVGFESLEEAKMLAQKLENSR